MNNLVFQEKEFVKSARVTMAIEEVLESYSSPFQKVEVYKTVPFGKMLVLDDVVMLTEYDNFAYHEMIAHVPMIVHSNPKKVLVVGGGDGGVLKEVLKHPSVEEVVVCEIDEEVVKVSKKHFPELASSFDDSRATFIAQDAAEYIKTKKNYFDVACVDSTDPIGPGEVLFTKEFYQNLEQALTEDGVVTTQSESMYYHRDVIASWYQRNDKIFKHAAYYFTVIPTYPSGTIGFSFCSKKYDAFENINTQRISSLKNLKYYNEAIHKASFQLPQFMKEKLQGQNKEIGAAVHAKNMEATSF